MPRKSTSLPPRDCTPEERSYQEELSKWVGTEFALADVGDHRLDKRLATIIEAFASYPQASIPQASGLWSQAKATYRFLKNKKVAHDKILHPHQQATQGRIGQQKVVLAIQDTTTLNYTHLAQTEGLGTISTNPKLRGMLVHTTWAVTPERLPLGVINQQTWTRPEAEYGKAQNRRKKSIQDKESQRWLDSLAVTETIQKENPHTLLINIADRESDIYELFEQASSCQCKLLIRASWDRGVNHPEKYLWPHLKAQPVAETMEVSITRKAKKKERTAVVEIRFASVTLNPPRHRPSLPPLSVWAIYVNEPNPPKGEEPLSWMLLTTLKVESAEQAIQCVQYYAVRFTIEIFHKVLKSGCRIEQRQLESAEGLRRCLALDTIVAYRILSLTMLGRTVPHLPCSVIFEEHEWKSLYCFVHKTPTPPELPPSLNEAIRMIARLGGFLGRKRDGHPGPTVLWRGLQRLSDISMAWIVFRPA